MNGIQVEEVRDPGAWDGALLALPLPHILQSWAWGESKQQTGWRAVRLLWRDGGTPVAAASLLVRRAGGGRIPAAVAYVPKGPVLDWNNGELAGAVLEQLLSRARHHRAIFLKIDPDLRSDTSPGPEILHHLQQRGWRLSAEQIQYRNTLVTQLAGDETMLAAMKPKWRYNIRLAERKGVTVRAGDQEDLARFYEMYAETGARDGFLVRPRLLRTDLAPLARAAPGAPAARTARRGDCRRDHDLPFWGDRLVLLRRIDGASPGGDAESCAAVGGLALGTRARMHTL